MSNFGAPQLPVIPGRNKIEIQENNFGGRSNLLGFSKEFVHDGVEAVSDLLPHNQFKKGAEEQKNKNAESTDEELAARGRLSKVWNSEFLSGILKPFKTGGQMTAQLALFLFKDSLPLGPLKEKLGDIFSLMGVEIPDEEKHFFDEVPPGSGNFRMNISNLINKKFAGREFLKDSFIWVTLTPVKTGIGVVMAFGIAGIAVGNPITFPFGMMLLAKQVPGIIEGFVKPTFHLAGKAISTLIYGFRLKSGGEVEIDVVSGDISEMDAAQLEEHKAQVKQFVEAMLEGQRELLVLDQALAEAKSETPPPKDSSIIDFGGPSQSSNSNTLDLDRLSYGRKALTARDMLVFQDLNLSEKSLQQLDDAKAKDPNFNVLRIAKFYREGRAESGASASANASTSTPIASSTATATPLPTTNPKAARFDPANFRRPPISPISRSGPTNSSGGQTSGITVGS